MGEVAQSQTSAAGGKAVHRPGDVKFLVCVDDRPQSRAALRFACQRVRNSGGSVALLHVIERPEFQHWAAIGQVMESEQRAEAEALLERLAGEVNEIAGLLPELHLRDGDVADEILAQVREDPTISLLVLGATAPEDKRFSLITELATRLIGRLRVPLVIVPGNLTPQEIDNLT